MKKIYPCVHVYSVNYLKYTIQPIVYIGSLVVGDLASESKGPGLDPHSCHPVWKICSSICPRCDKYDLE